jgi:hypothetical protein
LITQLLSEKFYDNGFIADAQLVAADSHGRRTFLFLHFYILAICDLRFAICDLRFAICDLRFAIYKALWRYKAVGTRTIN